MSSLNKVQLIGRLGKDPEVRYAPNGDAMCNITLATSKSWKDKASGEKKEKTEWHNISLYGRIAEVAGEYLKKGSLAYFEGELETRKWQDKETGADKYKTEIRCHEMKMLSGKSDAEGGGRDGNNSGQRSQSRPAAQQQQQRPAQQTADMDDDIPF